MALRFIETAILVFAELGYANCSLTDLCAAAGLSRPQFYEEFQNREDVLIAAYGHIQDATATAVSTAMTWR
ncbi:TetR family transcriptional regulator [Nocardia sp. NPDC050710]|uniref:TetR/AcrR family transcriptional regulator n=1 Tax=Nocardia sp. NPDC050710 TaxID=3157220 RepID=UPI003400E3EC